MMRKSLLEVTQNATRTEALKKITAGFQVFKHSDGIEYVVFSAQPRHQKPEAIQKPTEQVKEFFDPFAKEKLEKDLFVSQIHHTHHLVLNKFNVVDEHVVLPTIEYEPQETPLTQSDFRAMWTCMEQIDAFAFFNCGYESGASQPHKHMQLITYPSMKTYTPNSPMPPLLQLIQDSLKDKSKNQLFQLEKLPFDHLLHRLDVAADVDSNVAAMQVHDIYMKMMEELRATRPYVDTSQRPFVSYNLLLTRSFLYVIPRRQRAVEGIEINSIGFIGSFLVRDNNHQDQLTRLQQKGPLDLLAQVTFNKIQEIDKGHL